MDKRKLRQIHEYLGKHDWNYMPSYIMNYYEKAITKSRRFCSCGVIQWCQASYDGDWIEWWDDGSALATEAIKKAMRNPNKRDLDSMMDLKDLVEGSMNKVMKTPYYMENK